MEQAVAAYHDLLADEELAAASAAQLALGQHDRGLFFGVHPLSVSLRPRLLSATTWKRATAAAEAVADALATLEAAVLRDADLRRELDLLPEEEELALANPGCRASSPSSRLDSFFADEVRYVEFNAESPAGMAYGDVLGEVVDGLPVMQRFREQWALRPLPSRDNQLAAMLRAFREWGREPEPAVAIVDWANLPTVAEFRLFKEHLQAQGIACCICEPGSLEYDGRALHACDGSKVNLVYRRVLTSELLARPSEAAAIRRAYLDGAAVVVNTFRATLLHKKMSLALLSDDRYAALYTPAQRVAIARHVPWTRRLREGATTWQGKEVPDLLSLVLDRQQELVLKPNDEYGGKGVVLGWTVDEHSWEQSVTVGLHQSYVVQEAVAVPREQFPLAVGADVTLIDMAVDMDPYLFDGRAGGVLTRLSSSALLNVTAGAGSVVPTYVVEGRLR
jgi:hypothetical protein